MDARIKSGHDKLIPAARSTRVLPTTSRSPRSEGAGNAGRSMRPQPCVRNKKAHKHSHHGHTGITRHSLRNGFNGFLRALPGDRACLPPSPTGYLSARLDTSVGASGPHDFAVRGSDARLASLPRPPHPAPNVRDDRATPLRGGGTESIYFCFYLAVKRNFGKSEINLPAPVTGLSATIANHPRRRVSGFGFVPFNFMQPVI
jgi:hypothetical protein